MKQNKKRVMKFLIVVFIILFNLFTISIVIATDVIPTAFYNPSKDNPSPGNVGDLSFNKDFLVSLSTGATTYSYPIEVPKGTNGLTPLLLINYNSRGDNKPGILGTSWTLTENYIQRTINYTRNNVDDDRFELKLNGVSFDLVYDSSNGRYHTEIESYLYIQNFSGGNNTKGQYWVVKTTDGTNYRFGYNNKSEQVSNQENYTVWWYLDLVNDTYNNKIYYYYEKNPYSSDNGTVYPDRIQYNNDKKRSIEFIYESSDRPDIWSYYEQSNLFKISRRLKEIQIKTNDTLVRKYSLNYDYLDTRSFLKEISVYGNDNSSKLYTNSFSYYLPEKGWYQVNDWKSPYKFIWSYYSGTVSDEGVRFSDVNRDGYIDIVYGSKYDGDPESVEVWINNKTGGWKNETQGRFPYSVVSSKVGYVCSQYTSQQFGIDRGLRIFDLNNDGFDDLIMNPHYCNYLGNEIDSEINNTAYIGNGNSNWSKNDSLAIPEGKGKIVKCIRDSDFCKVYFGIDEGVRFVDLNGDGLQDIIGDNYQERWINNGTGWVSTNDWYLSEQIVYTSKSADYFNCPSQYGVDKGVRFIDINADGLTDILISRHESDGTSYKKVFMNNGKGFVEINITIPEYFVDDKVFADACNTRFGVDKGVRIVDINGDGFADIVKSEANNKYVYINNGSGWNLDNNFSFPIEIVNSLLEDQGVRLIDVNGDGLIDVVKATSNNKTTWLNNMTKPYLLKNITTSFGGSISIGYKKSTDLNNKGDDNLSDLGFNIWVVSNITQFNGMNNSHNVTSITVHNYSGGKYEYYPKNEFRGFSYVDEKIDDKKTKHWFFQDDGKKGNEYKTEILDLNDNPYKKQEFSFNSTFNNGYYITLLSEESGYTYDNISTNPKIKNISYSYDGFGNIIKKRFKGDISDSNDDKYEYYNYLNNTNFWIVNKIKNYSLLNNNSVKIKESLYSYDNLAYGQVPIKGSLTNKEDWLNTGNSPITRYSYDSYGNLINETDSNNHTTKYFYGIEDFTYTFPEGIKNSKNQTTYYHYDLGTGNILWKEDPNGIFTDYTYDVFGRKTSEILPYDNATYPTKKYEYNFDGKAPEKVSIMLREKNRTSNTFDSYSFYDGFGRLIQNKDESENQQQIVNDFYYNEFGKIKEHSNPYFINFYENYSSPNQSINKTKYFYDQSDRVIKIINPDGTNKNISYNHWNITFYDENGHRKDYQINAYNKIIEIREYNNGSIYRTIYIYDVSGNLIGIIDTKSNTFNYSYDSLGRKIRMQDPDVGVWNYSYDSVGNLLKQVDNRNITIFMDYDELNRLTKKNSMGENITYTYDLDKIGTISKVQTSDLIINYTYDNRLRKIKEEKTIDGTKFVLNWTYDSMDRVVSEFLPDRNNVTYVYNDQGSISAINDIVNISYNELNKPLKRIYKNNLSTNYTYNKENFRLINIKTDNKQDISYSYDPTGNVKEINDTIRYRKFFMNYDNLDRLIYTNIINYTNGQNKNMNFSYNEIGNMMNSFSNIDNMTFYYNSSLAHAPYKIITYQSTILPNDTSKFYHKDSSGDPVAWLGNQGNIVLKGKCFSGGNCDNPGDGSLIFRNESNHNLGYINITGDLCIIKGDCSDKSANCDSPADGAFIMANSTNYVSYIDGEGDLCLTGRLYENSDL